ncbi:MAG: LptF/LptG family permease [Opitutales bacterium]|nr:LptF/LptG family permease [Opitutales bacterium]
MRIVDRYVFVEWLKVFAATVGVTLGILILNDMYNELDDLLGFKASAPRICYYYWLLVPSFVPVILPISLLISVVFILGNFHKNNEIVAMRASGMNVWQITRSLWIAGFLLSCFLFWMNASVVPTSKENAATLYNNLKFESERKSNKNGALVGKISLLCFKNETDGRLWFINKFSQASKKAYGVEIHLMDKNGRETSKILAKEGVFDDLDMCWFFTNGQQIFFDAETSSSVKAEVFDKKYYREFKEDPQIMKLSMSRPKDLSLFELKKLILASGDRDSENMRPYTEQLVSLWVSPFACIIVVAIAIPFSISGVRTNPMVGVSKTAGLFFSYYLIDSLFSAMGSSGLMPVVLAAILPNLLMLLLALSMYRKAL